MLACALKYGAKVWPGVFIGAFVGNIWAYISFDSVLSAISAFFAATLNGVGDVIAIVLMALLIRYWTKHQSPFSSLQDFSVFSALGGLIGPFVSAFFGVTGLLIFGFLPSENYFFALTNWWIGDGVSVLLLTPLVLSFMTKQDKKTPNSIPTLLFCLLVFSIFTAIAFDLVLLQDWIVKVMILALPIAFVLLLYESQRFVFIIQVVVASIAVLATQMGLGSFASYQVVPPLMSLQLFVGMFSLVIFAIALVVNQKQMVSLELENQKKLLENLYRQDSLTGLWNRYRIEEFLELEIRKFKRSDVSFSVFMIDIDDFKAINDSLGHLEGDKILVEVSQLLKREIRDSDLLGRWGGEEFIIVAPEHNVEDSKIFASKLVKVVADHTFNINCDITISIGFTLSQQGDTNLTVVKRADAALYIAKGAGKNQYRFEV